MLYCKRMDESKVASSDALRHQSAGWWAAEGRILLVVVESTRLH